MKSTKTVLIKEEKKEWACPFPDCHATYVAKQSLNKHWDKKHPGEEIPPQYRVKKRSASSQRSSSPKRKVGPNNKLLFRLNNPIETFFETNASCTRERSAH
jgi:hypothetical protein